MFDLVPAYQENFNLVSFMIDNEYFSQLFYFLLVEGENWEYADERIPWWCVLTPVYAWWN